MPKNIVIEANANFHHVSGENLFEKKINGFKNIGKNGKNTLKLFMLVIFHFLLM